MSITIRDAVLEDAVEIEGVFRRASLSNENDRDLILRHPEWLILSDSGIRQGRTRVAVDEHNVVLGFATYLIVEEIAELEDLFVDPPQMRQRIGEALVLDISKQVFQLGFESLEVTANPHAMAFYVHMGFEFSRMVQTEGYSGSRMQRHSD